MYFNLFFVLLLAAVLFGIKAVWTSRLQISARRQIIGPLARKLGWCMIATPIFTAASVAACVCVLRLIGVDSGLSSGQGGDSGDCCCAPGVCLRR